jgi:putative membrane protein
MNSFVLFLKGIVIGMANVIPGVSGGTLAVVFNIYDKFVNVITPNVKKLWASKKFLIPLLCGMAIGVLLFSKAVSFLYENFPVQTNFVFSGLILGSVPLIFGYTKKRSGGKKIDALFVVTILLCVIFGFALIMIFARLDGKFSEEKIARTILPPVSAKLALRIFVAGILGAVVMIIPGISGSLIMLIMGVYTIVITSIPALFNPQTFMHALLLLLPNGIGVIIGLLCGAKMISFFLKKIPNHTYAVILGLLCGSFFTIFPGVKSVAKISTGIACVFCFAFGIFLAYFGSKTKD